MNIYLGQFILKKLKMKSYADKGGKALSQQSQYLPRESEYQLPIC